MLSGRFVFETEYERSLDDEPIMPENWVPNDTQVLKYVKKNDPEEFIDSLIGKHMWGVWQAISNYAVGIDKKEIWDFLIEEGEIPEL